MRKDGGEEQGSGKGGSTGAKEGVAYGLFYGDVLGSLGCVKDFVGGGAPGGYGAFWGMTFC